MRFAKITEMEGRHEHPEAVYSNFDHELDAAVVAGLMEDPQAYAQHAGWNFCGYVWFDGEIWHEQVWQWKAPVAELTNPDLRTLIDDVNEAYGHE